jgi:alpha-amylase/alpha-mannosidase (GH57 family)
LSQSTLRILARHGFRWTASGSQVLHNSLQQAGMHTGDWPQLDAWRPEGEALPACFFRDDGLSDLIGFEYSKWSAEDAVNDFIARLEAAREHKLGAGCRRPVLSIIMDGENAWEYFSENGWAFLQTLYARLANHSDFRLVTFSQALETSEPRALPRLCAGSWVHGSFSTWIGDRAKNRAWDLLRSAKLAVDAAMATGADDRQADRDNALLRQLAICEASDWFWWLGEDNRLQDSQAFDNMFRMQLEALYRMLGSAPPSELNQAVDDSGHLARSEVSGAMKRSDSRGVSN